MLHVALIGLIADFHTTKYHHKPFVIGKSPQIILVFLVETLE